MSQEYKFKLEIEEAINGYRVNVLYDDDSEWKENVETRLNALSCLLKQIEQEIKIEQEIFMKSARQIH